MAKQDKQEEENKQQEQILSVQEVVALNPFNKGEKNAVEMIFKGQSHTKTKWEILFKKYKIKD